MAYRYLKDNDNLNFIHISVIPKGVKIPRYGNYFIADTSSDYILYATWDKKNTLVFYSNEQYHDLIPHYLVRTRHDIKYKIVIDKRYSGKYRWVKKLRHS